MTKVLEPDNAAASVASALCRSFERRRLATSPRMSFLAEASTVRFGSFTHSLGLNHVTRNRPLWPVRRQPIPWFDRPLRLGLSRLIADDMVRAVPGDASSWGNAIGPRTASERAIAKLWSGESAQPTGLEHSIGMASDALRWLSSPRGHSLIDRHPSVLVSSLIVVGATTDYSWARTRSRELLAAYWRTDQEVLGSLQTIPGSANLETFGQQREMRQALTYIVSMEKRHLTQRKLTFELKSGGASNGLTPFDEVLQEQRPKRLRMTDGADLWTPTECDARNAPREARAGPSISYERSADRGDGDDAPLGGNRHSPQQSALSYVCGRCRVSDIETTP